MKIYVVEGGDRYDGGGALAASTDFVSAWKYVREHRIASESENRSPMRLKRKHWWVGEYDYLRIIEVDDVRF